jgi:hypothetical protein
LDRNIIMLYRCVLAIIMGLDDVSKPMMI